MPASPIAARNRHRGHPAVIPQPLFSGDLPGLMLEDHPRVSTDIAEKVLNQSPGSSWWIPATSEFILVTPWRHRSELVSIHTLGAFANEHVLMAAAMDHARLSGKAGFVVVDLNELRQPVFYQRHGLVETEKIITFEHRQPALAIAGQPKADLEFRRVTAANGDLYEQVIALDHSAFPWFWWNSRTEFETYLAQRGVEIWVGICDDAVVTYAGITLYHRWGHLDRIATTPDLQGQGIGRDMLTFALARVVQLGGRRVALSTQGSNFRSRSLYEHIGFRHTPIDDYVVYTAEFALPPGDAPEATSLVAQTSQDDS